MEGIVSKRIMIVLSLFLLVFSGCVSTQVDKSSEKPIFFPPEPDLPRYQFLTSFIGSEDFDDEVSGIDRFLGASQGGYRLKKPYGVSVVNGAIYVVDTQNSVWKFDLRKEKMHKIAGDKGLGKLVQPINISIDGKANKYVTDPVRGVVAQYDSNDFYVRNFARTDPWKPVDAEVYEEMLYVVDSTHGTGGIHVFDLKTGEFVEKLGQSGPPDQRLQIATNIAFDNEGYLYVMDAGRFQLVKYDRDGHYRGHLGDPGDSPGFFGRPRGVAVDNEGRVYAVDAAFDIVQVFSSMGQVLTMLGGPGTSPGTMTLPAGVFIDYDHLDLFQKYAAPGFEIEYLVFVTNQFHDTSGVNVYGYGKMSNQKYPSDDELLEEIKKKNLLENSNN